ncbi:ribosomal RNA small subunit methyltransferase A [candidate division KSB1 bacterium]|nr:ribosomal RNA small subunit methyltransferase A [candidate division KSB1 bacterium]
MPRPDIKPKQSLGQNFLTDKNIALKIVHSLQLDKEDTVLEIGPGLGVLTKIVQPKVRKLVAVEIDRNLAAMLEEQFSECPNCEIVQSDFLQYNMSDFKEKNIRVIGNIPYNITSPILFKIIDNRSAVKDLTMLIQKEVAQRIVTRPNTKDYGILAVFSQTFAEVKILMHVPSTVFSPKPKVESSLVRWVFTEEYAQDILDIELFKKIVRQAFGKRRKMLRNSLREFFELNTGIFDYTKRPEQLDIKEWIGFANKMKAIIPVQKE